MKFKDPFSALLVIVIPFDFIIDYGIETFCQIIKSSIHNSKSINFVSLLPYRKNIS